MKKQFEYRLGTEVTWGRVKGKTIEEIINTDIEWIKWAYKKGLNSPEFNFKLHIHAFNYLVEKNGLKKDKNQQQSFFGRHSKRR